MQPRTKLRIKELKKHLGLVQKEIKGIEEYIKNVNYYRKMAGIEGNFLRASALPKN